MGWLIGGLLLALAGGLAVFTRWRRHRPVADDTLLAELLGTPVRLPPPARREQEQADPPPVPGPPPAGRGSTQPAAERSAQPAGDGGWLETQLAWISAWSERMQNEIAASAPGPAGPPPAALDPAAAPPAGPGRLADHESSGPPPPRLPAQRCTAITAKGSQCRLSARPGETTCAIHARRHP